MNVHLLRVYIMYTTIDPDSHPSPFPFYCSAGWLSMGVVAQWQSAGSSSQRPWVRSPASSPFFLSLSLSVKGHLVLCS